MATPTLRRDMTYPSTGLMTSFLAEIRQTIIPDPSGHGPLPLLLVTLTVVTGLVDAFSYLVLGHVFVANMTGNVVFLGFALAGAQGFSIPASVVALGAFGIGALGGGRLGSAMSRRRGTLLAATAAVQVVFLAGGVVMAALAGSPVPAGYRYGLIVVLAISMGVQNATARRLAVPDLTTTVLTLTIVGIAADSDMAGGGGSRAGRRLISVTAMLAGALVGAALVVHVQIVYPLVIALVAVAIVAVTTRALAASRPAWATAGES
jgi:uncharacterized membrane protein YoaK (UPF0700 family)